MTIRGKRKKLSTKFEHQANHIFYEISGYQKEKERRSRPKDKYSLMLNLVVEKEANKDHDQSGSSIT